MSDCKPKCSQHYSGIGGQAVLEGVMMRNGIHYATAVRRPDGSVIAEPREYHGILEDSKLKTTPFVRGIFVFIDSLILGMKCINYSAEIYAEEEEDADKTAEQKEKETGLDSVLSVLVTVIAFLLAIGLFFVLPYFISSLLGRFVHSHFLLAVAEGLIRIGIFIAYISGISLMEDIKRLYRYHGAEHKCINCIENGLPLTVENARKSTRFHKRCGSSFLIFVMMVSIVLFFFIRVESPLMKVLLRILLIPVISGISFELIRLAGSSDNPVINLLSKPGIWLQHLTTSEPDDSMLEVAIASVEAVFDWKEYLKEEFGTEIPEGSAPAGQA